MLTFSEIFVHHNLRANEATLKVSVDDSSRFWSESPVLNRPRFHFVRASRKEMDQLQSLLGAVSVGTRTEVGTTWASYLITILKNAGQRRSMRWILDLVCFQSTGTLHIHHLLLELHTERDYLPSTELLDGRGDPGKPPVCFPQIVSLANVD
jgi:hypothetical protein